MAHLFQFYFPDAEQVSVIGDFNNWSGDDHSMLKDGNGVWRLKVPLEPGQYNYRYLIDDKLEMNDPVANLYLPVEKGKLASYLKIDNNKRAVVNSRKYKLELHSYQMTGAREQQMKKDKNNHEGEEKDFTIVDGQIQARFKFTRVEGLHTLTLLWRKPNGQIFHWDEGVLRQEIQQPVEYNFWLDLHPNLPTGSWTLEIFLNGALILRDAFKIKPLTYDSHYKQHLRNIRIAETRH